MKPHLEAAYTKGREARRSHGKREAPLWAGDSFVKDLWLRGWDDENAKLEKPGGGTDATDHPTEDPKL